MADQPHQEDLDKVLSSLQGAEFTATESPAGDARANKEAHALANNISLQKDGEIKEHGRHQTFREHVNRASIVIFWGLVFCILWCVAASAWHFLMPSYWHYLDSDQLESINTFLTTALFSSALTGYVNKRMS